MTTQDFSTPAVTAHQPTARAGWAALAVAIGFVGCYFATDMVVRSVASYALPLPTDPVGLARDWYADNQLAAVIMGAGQLLSVGFLGAFALLLPATSRTPAKVRTLRRARGWGLAAMGLMMLSSLLGWLLAAVAPGAPLETVSALRTAGFVTGGTAHVAVLGAFVWWAGRTAGFSKPVRGLAVVAAVVSVLSLISLVWFYGAVLILLGRLLCMLWTLSAGVSIVRGLRTGRWV